MKEVGIKPVESSNQRGEALAAPLSVIDHLSLEYGQSREIMSRKKIIFVLIFLCLSVRTTFKFKNFLQLRKTVSTNCREATVFNCC